MSRPKHMGLNPVFASHVKINYARELAEAIGKAPRVVLMEK